MTTYISILRGINVSGKNASEDFLVSNKEIYLFCPNGYGKTKLTNSFLEKKQELLLPHGTGKQ